LKKHFTDMINFGYFYHPVNSFIGTIIKSV